MRTVKKENKWISTKDKKPSAFNLCELKTASRIINGWFTGAAWDSSKNIQYEDILFWRPQRMPNNYALREKL